jgi:hypothetical protein
MAEGTSFINAGDFRERVREQPEAPTGGQFEVSSAIASPPFHPL